MNNPSVCFFVLVFSWTLTVAMVTENDRQNRLKSVNRKRCNFEPQSGG